MAYIELIFVRAVNIPTGGVPDMFIATGGFLVSALHIFYAFLRISWDKEFRETA